MAHKFQEKYLEYTLLILIIIMGYALVMQSLPFINGILGAITLYIMLRRTNFYIMRRYGRKKAPWIITLATALLIMAPTSAALWYVVDLIQNFNLDFNVIIERLVKTANALEQKTGIDLISEKSMTFITAKITAVANMLLGGINNFAVNIFTALLILFFMLSGGMYMERYISRILPFKEQNKKIIINKINTIVKSNAIGIPLLALIQGVVAAIGYYIFDVSNALTFGVLTGFASIIPLVGTMLVWIPLCIGQYFEGDIYQTLGLAAYCIIVISQCDNVLRMFLQKKMADTHPLITIFGVIAGLPIFGFMGIIFGPLLVAMFLLLTDMFARQYIIGTDNLSLDITSLNRHADKKDDGKNQGSLNNDSVKESIKDNSKDKILDITADKSIDSALSKEDKELF